MPRLSSRDDFAVQREPVDQGGVPAGEVAAEALQQHQWRRIRPVVAEAGVDQKDSVDAD